MDREVIGVYKKGICIVHWAAFRSRRQLSMMLRQKPQKDIMESLCQKSLRELLSHHLLTNITPISLDANTLHVHTEIETNQNTLLGNFHATKSSRASNSSTSCALLKPVLPLSLLPSLKLS